MKNTVAIIGSHPRTRSEFDFDRTDCDIWLFNEALSNKENAWAKRADVIFQMHEEAIWRNPRNRNDPKHFEWLNTQTETTVYMQETYPDVPRSVKFPIDEIVERFKISYFTSSVAYALALACYQGYKRIELYGVEMETNTEYQYQRDGVTLWIGVALGLGIEVDAHIGIFDQPLYGYEGEVAIPYERFGERMEEIRPKLEEANKQYRAHMGVLKTAIMQFYNDSSLENEKILFAVSKNQCDLGETLGMFDGAYQENEKYKGKADTMKEAAGEYLFSRQEFESSAKNLSDKAAQNREAWIEFGNTLGMMHEGIKRAAKGSKKREKMLAEYMKQMDIYLQTYNHTAVFKGASQENFAYMAWLDKHIRAAGGSKSEAVLLERMQDA